jgi:hypothetical protein
MAEVFEMREGGRGGVKVGDSHCGRREGGTASLDVGSLNHDSRDGGKPAGLPCSGLAAAPRWIDLVWRWDADEARGGGDRTGGWCLVEMGRRQWRRWLGVMPPILLRLKPWSRTAAELGEPRPASLAGSSTTSQSRWEDQCWHRHLEGSWPPLD